MRIKVLIILVCLVLLSGTANAGTVTFSGYLDDSSNTSLVGSDLGTALFGDDYGIANNVALYDLSIPVAGEVHFISNGFQFGGRRPLLHPLQGN